MKKSVLIGLCLLSWVLLTACGKKSDEVVVNDQLSGSVVEFSSCEKTIRKYLDNVDKKWSWEGVQVGDNVVVDYIWRLEDGTVFDTTIWFIAEACDIYDEYRDYTQWYEFSVWMNQREKWFDSGVVWMKLWQTKTIQFWPEEWYWLYNKNDVVKYTIDEIGDLSKFIEWETIDLWIWMSAKIVKVTDKDVTLDFNHELAGKNLIFDITLKSIN